MVQRRTNAETNGNPPPYAARRWFEQKQFWGRGGTTKKKPYQNVLITFWVHFLLCWIGVPQPLWSTKWWTLLLSHVTSALLICIFCLPPPGRVTHRATPPLCTPLDRGAAAQQQRKPFPFPTPCPKTLLLPPVAIIGASSPDTLGDKKTEYQSRGCPRCQT